MVHDGELAVSFLDVGVRSVFLDAEDLVVVLSLRLLQLEFCVANVFCNSRIVWVCVGDGFVLSDGFFPVSALSQCLGFCLACLCVGGIELSAFSASLIASLYFFR